jgi:hypothetical protein
VNTGVKDMIDIEGWGGPEQLGLRRAKGEPATIARRGGTVALLLGAGLWGLGMVSWSGDLACLAALNSPQSQLAAALCAVSGMVALALPMTVLRDRHR